MRSDCDFGSVVYGSFELYFQQGLWQVPLLCLQVLYPWTVWHHRVQVWAFQAFSHRNVIISEYDLGAALPTVRISGAKIMKKIHLLFIATAFLGCGKQEMVTKIDIAEDLPTSLSTGKSRASTDSVMYYFEQARLGIGDAYVKMAQYYHDGTMGKPNLLNMLAMGAMAEEYMAIPNMNTLFKDVPESDVTKMTYQALSMINHTDCEEILSAKSKELLDMGIPEGYLMQAIMSWKEDNREDAITFCDKSIQGGSTFADIFKDIIVAGEDYSPDLNPEILLMIADRFPMAYRLLGDHYAKIPNDSASDIPLARRYYLKASDHACLGRREALWVLETIYINGYPAVDSLIEKRLWSLGRNEINDSVIWLP